MKGADIHELWTAIERDVTRQSGAGYVLRRASVDCKVDLFLGIKCPENQKALILRVPADALPEPRALPETRGLRVFVERLRDDADGTASIIVQLREAGFADVFFAFCTILVNRTCAATTPARAAGELLSQVMQWQKFLDARSEGLGEEEQRGLYGELHVLRQFLQATRTPRIASGWVGPSGAAQDFRYGRSVAIEVKTSIAGEPQAIRVNGERQLDDSNLDRLYLVCLSIERRAGIGETLPELVSWLRDFLEGHPIEVEGLETALLEFGYLNAHEQKYRSHGFSIRNQRCFRVHGDFPRITEAALPEAVGQVGYKIALAGCARFAVAFEDIVAALSVQADRVSG